MKMRLPLSTVVTFIALLILNQPAFFYTIGPINSLYRMAEQLVWLGLLALVALNFRLFLRNSFTFWAIAFFYGVLFASTYLNRGPMGTTIKYIFPILLGTFLVDHISPRDFKGFLLGASLSYSLLTYINVLSVFLFPGGLYRGNLVSTTEKYYFLGHNNATIRIMVSAIIFTGLYDYVTKSRLTLKSHILILSVFASVVMTWSNTAMIGSMVFIIFILFIEHQGPVFGKLVATFSDARLFFGLSLSVFFIFVLLGSTSDIVTTIVTDVFQKDMTFTGQTYLWDNSIKAIGLKPTLGYGFGKPFWEIAHITWFNPVSAHNLYIVIMLRGGILQLLILIVLLVYLNHRLMGSRDKLMLFCAFSLLSYYLMWNFEPFLTTGVLGMFLFLQSVERISLGKTEDWRKVTL